MFVFFLFRCCWLLSYFISFYGSNTCLFSFWNKPPFERNLFYVKVFFNLYLYYHLIIHSRMHRHARFVGELAFSSGVTFRASYYVRVHVYTLTDGRPGVKILGDEKRYRTETINTYSLKKSNLKIHCNVI